MDNEPDDYTRAVAAVLTDAKSERGFTFDSLAKASGLGRATVVRVLGGERHITVHYLRALGAPLGLTPKQILEEADKRL